MGYPLDNHDAVEANHTPHESCDGDAAWWLGRCKGRQGQPLPSDGITNDAVVQLPNMVTSFRVKSMANSTVNSIVTVRIRPHNGARGKRGNDATPSDSITKLPENRTSTTSRQAENRAPGGNCVGLSAIQQIRTTHRRDQETGSQ